MEVIQEDTVRQLFLRRGVTEVHVSRGTYVTDQARSYMREKGIRLIEDGAASQPAAKEANEGIPVNKGIRPAPEMAKGTFVTLDGTKLSEKPEHMTHLHGNVLVPKTHPRIIFRGRLDSLQADILLLELQAQEVGDRKLADGLQETLDFCRGLMSAEVTDKPFEAGELLGMDEATQREVSHHPKKYLGTGHLMPDARMGRLALGLNKLRTTTREVELACVSAFTTEDGTCERVDLVRALNRLSSTFYIMMLSQLSGHSYREDK